MRWTAGLWMGAMVGGCVIILDKDGSDDRPGDTDADTDAPPDTDDTDTDAPPDTDDTDVAPLCADRTGGAMITLQVVDDSFTFWSTNPTFIDQAIHLKDTGATQVPVFDVVAGTGCDTQWSWTVDPADQSWADLTIEVCDAVPSYIETVLDGWITSPGSWCPWSAVVTAVDDRR